MQRLVQSVLMKYILENLTVIPRKMHVNAFSQVVRKLFKVPSVGVRQNQLHDFTAPRSNDFLSNATHWQHLPCQG